MQQRFTAASQGGSIVLTAPQMSQAYWLVAIAMFMTMLGVYAGATYALPIVASGWLFALFILELGIILTASAWSRSAPLNYILFFAFPFLSGLTITPFLLSVITGYANGAVILLNATVAATLLTVAAAVFARSTSMNIGAVFGRFLFQSLIGLVIFGLLQLFIPSLRGTGIEMIVSGVGIVTFSLFLAWDIQRLSSSDRGVSPFLLALSLYLDIFNLFLYVVRFMLAMSGERR